MITMTMENMSHNISDEKVGMSVAASNTEPTADFAASKVGFDIVEECSNPFTVHRDYFVSAIVIV